MNYAVRQGDCLSSIAAAFGFADFAKIYQHPANEELRRLRPNPNILCPGDQLFIPAPEQRQIAASTDQTHRFVMQRARVQLRLRLEDDRHVAYADTRYELRIGDAQWQGSTDGDGLVTQEIPVDATEGEITVFPPSDDPDDPGYAFPLQLGHLDPIDEDAGVDARLLNLGYGLGQDEGSLSDDERADALRAFQAEHGLEVSGEATQETRSKLLELHDGE